MSCVSHTHVFAGDPLNRADHERRDPSWVEARLADQESKFLPLADLRVLIRHEESPALGWLGPDSLAHLRDGASPVLLGTNDDRAYFAFDASESDSLAASVRADRWLEFEDPREIARHLSTPESGTLAHAKSLVDWHHRHGYCANCGGVTHPALGGKQRDCGNCGAHHFPRTDPVAIMLVYDGDRCLLGRGRRRVNRLYSALAGFVDQGESIEEAVRREVKEESGIDVGRVYYHSSQPWPYPSSLMIGCIAEALSTEISVDEHELADVSWFDRHEVLEALERGGKTDGGFNLPNPIAIAHYLIRDWASKKWTPK